jgi:hypothetical protein
MLWGGNHNRKLKVKKLKIKGEKFGRRFWRLAANF